MTVGATVQGSIGFGANLLAVPVLAILEPDALPATLTIWVLPLAVSMAVRERRGIDWHGATAIVAWRIPGTVVGAATVAAVSTGTLSVLAGLAVLVAVAVSALSATVPINRLTLAAAGLASGVMGTATSIGGPPLALLYQRRDGPVLRSTLGVMFVAGLLISLVGQAVAGVVAGWHVVLALALLPGAAVGVALSGTVSRRIDGPRLRPAVLVLAAVAALVAVAHGLG